MSATEAEPSIEMMTHVPGHYALGVWKNVMVLYFVRQATVATIKDLTMQWNVMAARHPRFSYVGLIKEGAGLPDGDARLALRDLHDQYANETVCIGIVLMGSGFWASALRGMVTGVRQLAKRKRTSELRTAATAGELRDWFVSTHSAKSGTAISAKEYDSIVAAMLAQAS